MENEGVEIVNLQAGGDRSKMPLRPLKNGEIYLEHIFLVKTL